MQVTLYSAITAAGVMEEMIGDFNRSPATR